MSWPDDDIIMLYTICIHNIYVYYIALVQSICEWYCMVLFGVYTIHGIAWFDKRA